MNTENTTPDLLQIKIEKAKMELSQESRDAIDAVDWKNIILGMRAEKGYSFTQLEDLVIETELLLCGLLSPEDYPKELEKRMGIPKPKVDELVDEINDRIFKRIREELIKNIESRNGSITNDELRITNEQNNNLESREEMIEKIEHPVVKNTLKIDETGNESASSILSQKLSGSFKIQKTETEHTLGNITKDSTEEKPKIPQVDPYRMPIE